MTTTLSHLVHPTAVVDGEIGEGTYVGPHAWVGPCVRVGDNCVIGPGAVIGWDGFGYEHVNGRWEQKPQNFGVVVEDDVHVGANACIDRGSYRDTVIGRGTKIDNLVHIAHNVQVGRNCLIIACAELSGSVVVGDDCHVAPCAAVREHVTLADEAFVGLGAVVVSDVPLGEVVYGVPAKTRAERER